MKDRNFLVELLQRDVAKPQVNTQLVAELEEPQPIATIQPTTTPISVLDSRQSLANALVSQSRDRSSHPLARGIAAYFGGKQLGDINKERAATEAEIQRRKAAEKEAAVNRELQEADRRFRLEEQKLGLQEKQMQQRAEQFDKSLALEADQFNKKYMRDAADNAVVKLRDDAQQVDLLFKGNAPVTDGLDKGMQWGIDDAGTRVAVPIPTKPNEQAALQRQLTIETVDRLLANPEGLRDNFGFYDQYTPSISPNTRQAETDLNQLRALLTVDNLDLMSGVLSETDIKILQNVAGGGIAETASEEGAVQALKRIRNTLVPPKKTSQKAKDSAANFITGNKATPEQSAKQPSFSYEEYL